MLALRQSLARHQRQSTEMLLIGDLRIATQSRVTINVLYVHFH